MGTEVVIVTRAGAKLALNETAVEVLALCDGRRSVQSIGAELARRHRQPAAEIQVQVARTLTTLRGAGVLRA